MRHLFGVPGPSEEPTFDDQDLADLAVEELRAAATLMSEAQRVANFGSWEWRLNEDQVSWSEQLYRIFGLDPATFSATFDAYLDRVHPSDREHVRHEIKAAVEDRRACQFEHRIVQATGEERLLRCQLEPILNPANGGVVRVIGVCQDISELAETERARAEADARFRSAFENAPIGIALVDFTEGPDGRLTEVNRALAELTRRSEKELTGWALTELSMAEDAEVDHAMRARLVAGEIERYSIEKRTLVDDRIVWLQLSVSALPEPGAGGKHGIVQVQDVTERKQFEDQLRYIADHDSLTGLMNRRRFREEFEAELARQRRYGGRGALLLIDVDRLKAINDSRGHGVGDLALRRVAEVMRRRMRSTDILGRLAGDEFAILLPSVGPAQAGALGDELVGMLAAEEVDGWSLSVSVGVAPFGAGEGEDPGSVEDVTAAADAALYRVKQEGGGVAETARGRVPAPAGRVPAPAAHVAPRAPLSAGVRTALEEDRLMLYAQPAINLRTGDADHRELLLRMRDESGAVLAASEFLAAATQVPGLSAELDRWVVARAIAMLENGSRGERLQVNVSGETLADRTALDRLIEALGGTGQAPQGLALEISEGSIRRDPDGATEAMYALLDTGCRLVLDGFSAGFGSFEYLQRLPLDQVKIDGAVIKTLVGDQPDHATMRAIVRLAEGTGKRTVAKFVESEALIPVLRMHGVDMAQGFELGKPAPLDA